MTETFWRADVYGPEVTLCDEHATGVVIALADRIPDISGITSPAELLAVLDAIRCVAGHPEFPLPFRESEGPCVACEEEANAS